MAPPIASVESAEASMYAFSEMVKRAFRRAKPCRSFESKRHVVNASLHLQYDTGFSSGKSREWKVEKPSEVGVNRSKHEANNAIIMRSALTLTTNNEVCKATYSVFQFVILQSSQNIQREEFDHAGHQANQSDRALAQDFVRPG